MPTRSTLSSRSPAGARWPGGARWVVVALALFASGCADPGGVLPAEGRQVDLRGRFQTIASGDTVGVYGLRVRLLGKRNGAWEPLPGADRRHRSFDVADPEGAFRFTLATASLSRYDSLMVAPEAATEAVRIVPRPPGAVRVGETFASTSDAIRLAVPPEGPVVRADLYRTLRSEVGVTVRWSTISREFVYAIYDGDPPFDLPPVQVELSQSGGFVFQSVDPDALGGHEIELNAARGITPTLVGHEYGHYANFQMWGANPLRYALRNRNLREGWAIFFSFAARAYGAAMYGDRELVSSNPERAAFSHLSTDRQRYEGIVYGRSRPDYAAIGSLLWSLYDRAEPSPFEPAALAGDNDDVSGYELAVFESVRQARASVFDEAGIIEVMRAFRTFVPSDLVPSVDGAFDHFLCPDFPACDVKAVPDGRPGTGALTLRPVSPSALRAERLPPDAVRLTWTPRTYATSWANPPERYRVYRDGAPVAVAGPFAREAVIVDNGDGGRFEVRAEGAAGESFGGAAVDVEPAQ
ncbi:MAG: hypothetical protein AAGK21_16575 [Bacteroidota bacterium]